MTLLQQANRADIEAKLITLFDQAPEYSLAWEAYQHAQFSWDGSILSWIEAIAASRDFADLYGFGCVIDEDELTTNPDSHLAEMMSLWAQSQHHHKVPSPNAPNFLTHVYWFALRTTAMSVAVQAGASWLGD